MSDARRIITFDDSPPPPGESPWVLHHRSGTSPQIVAPDPDWPAQFAALRERVARAPGTRALSVEHVGSTAVPGLAAKPVIDVDLVVAESDDASAYVALLG